ncbi:MAG: hypothetical protein KJ906_02460 [Nanoarchaeota archaeon]|nr:hypothetical protein [Nanoarchaeota archaeon]
MIEDEKKLTIARLEHMPAHIKLAIGSFGSFDKWELMQAVKDENPLGNFLVNEIMEDVRSFKKADKNDK